MIHDTVPSTTARQRCIPSLFFTHVCKPNSLHLWCEIHWWDDETVNKISGYCGSGHSDHWVVQSWKIMWTLMKHFQVFFRFLITLIKVWVFVCFLLQLPYYLLFFDFYITLYILTYFCTLGCFQIINFDWLIN